LPFEYRKGYLKTSYASFAKTSEASFAKTNEVSFCEAKMSEMSFAKTQRREVPTKPGISGSLRLAAASIFHHRSGSHVPVKTEN